jgi:hypothetical protein
MKRCVGVLRSAPFAVPLYQHCAAMMTTVVRKTYVKECFFSSKLVVRRSVGEGIRS